MFSFNIQEVDTSYHLKGYKDYFIDNFLTKKGKYKIESNSCFYSMIKSLNLLMYIRGNDETGKVICIVKDNNSIVVNNLYKRESLTTTGNVRHPHQRFYKRFCVLGKNEITVIDILEKIEGEKYYGRSGAVYDKFFRPLEYGDLKVII